MTVADDLRAAKALSDREKAVLLSMAESLSDGYCWPFARIAAEVKMMGQGCEPSNIRRVTRALARKGYTYFQRGLFTEDGELAGSGYGVTEKGYAYRDRAILSTEAHHG